jgi:hypothetical protein
MHLEQYFQTVTQEEYFIKLLIYRKVKRAARVSLSSDEQDDIFQEVMTSTAEKISAGTLTLHNADEVKKYLLQSGWFNFKNEQNRRKKERNLDTYSYTNEYFDSNDEKKKEKLSSADVYTKVFEYVYDKYSFEEAGLFKAYIVNKLTYTQLAEMTGKRRMSCFTIVRKIKNDLKKNKNLLDFMSNL